MRSGGLVFAELERKADRWRAQYEHWPALVTKERSDRREERKNNRKTASASTQKPSSSPIMPPFLYPIWRWIPSRPKARFRSDNPDSPSRSAVNRVLISPA